MGRKKSEFGIYEFRFVGRLDPCWLDWFEGLEIHDTEEGETGSPVTVLTCPMIGQAILYGILEKFSCLNFKLLSVNKV